MNYKKKLFSWISIKGPMKNVNFYCINTLLDSWSWPEIKTGDATKEGNDDDVDRAIHVSRKPQQTGGDLQQVQGLPPTGKIVAAWTSKE